MSEPGVTGWREMWDDHVRKAMNTAPAPMPSPSEQIGAWVRENYQAQIRDMTYDRPKWWQFRYRLRLRSLRRQYATPRSD